MMRRVSDLFEELRSRSVFRALVAYSVASWMLLQVADVTFDRLPLPDNAMTVLIVLVAVGFPVAAILAWGYEFTVQGIVRHEKTSGGAPRMPFILYVGIVAVVALVTGSLLYFLSQNYWEPSRRSIAVLPFTNTSDDADTDYFSDGLTEEIQSLIVRLNEFRVVALSTTSQLKGTVTDVASIANRLGAEVVLTGSVRRYQNKIAVTARLIDGGDGGELWSENYDRQLSDIYTIQEDIARRVARALHVVLPVSSERRLKNLGTRNIDAYDSYLRALYRLSHDPVRFGAAEQACQRALEIDEDSAEMHFALGDLYQASGKNENAIHEYEEALKDNSNIADIYIGMAMTYSAQQRVEEAEANLRLAIEADVSYWASFNAMGNFLFNQSRFLEAAEFYQMFISRADDDARALNNLGAAYYLAGEFRRAAEAWDESLAIKPTRGAYANTGSMYFYLGEFDKAADRYAYAANLAPNDYQLWGNLGDAYSYSSDMQRAAQAAYLRAIRLGEQKLAINDGDVAAISDVAYYNSRVGNYKKATAMSDQAASLAPNDMYVHYNAALIHMQLGNIDEVLSSLERAVELQYQPELLSLDPAFDKLRDEERFKRLGSKKPE